MITIDPIKAAEKKNVEILAQIAVLEGQQTRPLRELTLDPNNAYAKDKLASLDAQIATLRLQIV